LPVPANACRNHPIIADKAAENRALLNFGTAIANHIGRGSRSCLLFTDNGTVGGKFRGKMQMAADPLFGVHGAALAIRSQRLAMLASNIANAGTPGYKARDVDFDQAMALATGDAQSADKAVDASTKYRVPIQPSQDGNTVELSTEQTMFAENAVQYRTTLSFLQGRIDTVMQALRGE
jgi:flagellar basal-body rod protein FlgB